MKHLNRSFPALVLLGLALAVSASLASEQIAKDTGRSCTSCHDKPGSRLLTDAGKYYETMHSLAGYDTLRTTFGRCTSCHVRKPGSRKLTRRGQEYAALVKDMPALGEWIRTNHPAPPAK